jgi:hypothetical protein
VCVGAQLKDAHNVAALLRDNAALMEAVLKDVLSDSDSPLENEEQGEMRKLYFAREPLEGTPRYGSTLDTVNRDEGGVLVGQLKKHAKEALADLGHRDRDVFRTFAPKDSRVIVVEKEDVEKEKKALVRRIQIFKAYTPGYSRNGEVAVVRLEFPWGIHSGYGFYVMAKRNGNWTVLIRDVVCLF